MPGADKPDSPLPMDRASYIAWLKDALGIAPDSALKNRYEAVVNKIRSDFAGSDFWTRAIDGMANIDGQYRVQAENYPLFLSSDEPPQLATKSFSSYFNKTYRRNVLENENWPTEPLDGWLRPGSDFSRLNDLVRTTFVVKYLDGVAFLAEHLEALSEECGCVSELTFEARMEGHYAAHFLVTSDFDIPTEQWDTERVPITVEIQITTQLQEVIGRLTHGFYEQRRIEPAQQRPNWQWNYKSDEFTANYLGHILHYVEGMIMEVRSKQADTKGARTW